MRELKVAPPGVGALSARALRPFDVLLELLQTVEEGHHGGVEFGVPQEAEAAGTVQR